MCERLMVSMSQNAGVVDTHEGPTVTFKGGSHKYPSYIEPFQGAPPVAGMDQLRFGTVVHTKPA